jgi:hypothetical protein
MKMELLRLRFDECVQKQSAAHRLKPSNQPIGLAGVGKIQLPESQ